MYKVFVPPPLLICTKICTKFRTLYTNCTHPHAHTGGSRPLATRTRRAHPGTCDAQYSCKDMYEVVRVARAFNPNFATNHLDPGFVDAMAAITPLQVHGLITSLKKELLSRSTSRLRRMRRALIHRTWTASPRPSSTGGARTARRSLLGRLRRASSSASRRTKLRASAFSPCEDHVWRGAAVRTSRLFACCSHAEVQSACSRLMLGRVARAWWSHTRHVRAPRHGVCNR